MKIQQTIRPLLARSLLIRALRTRFVLGLLVALGLPLSAVAQADEPALTARAQKSSAQALPPWLLELPALPVPVTLGVATQNVQDPKGTLEAAQASAARNFQLLHGVMVELDRRHLHLPFDQIQEDASQVTPLLSGPDGGPKSVLCLDTWHDTRHNLLWCLAAPAKISGEEKEEALKALRTLRPKTGQEKPAWLTSPPSPSNGRHAASGHCVRTPHGYPKQLELAIARGLIALARQGLVGIAAETRSQTRLGEQALEAESHLTGAVTVRAVQLQSLWRAVEGDTLFVLLLGRVE